MKPSGKAGRGVPARAGRKGKRKGGSWYKTVFERSARRKVARAAARAVWSVKAAARVYARKAARALRKKKVPNGKVAA